MIYTIASTLYLLLLVWISPSSTLAFHFECTGSIRSLSTASNGITSDLRKHEKRSLHNIKKQHLQRGYFPYITNLYDASMSSVTGSSFTMELEAFLQQEHSMFYTILLSNNDFVWKTIRDAIGTGNYITIFAPINQAIEQLGSKKLQQLQDNRNEEVKYKIASYHIVSDDTDIISIEQLYNSGGIRTIATGDNPIVPIERTKQSKGIFDIFTGGTETNDGTVTIGSNNGRIVNTYYLQSCNTVIHQVDALISPNILWRYMDQLRIPGSK